MKINQKHQVMVRKLQGLIRIDIFLHRASIDGFQNPLGIGDGQVKIKTKRELR